MPSQDNIKEAKVLLDSLSELQAYLAVLIKLREGRSKDGVITVSAANAKYTYDMDTLNNYDILGSLITAGQDTMRKTITDINTLLYGKDSGLAAESR